MQVQDCTHGGGGMQVCTDTTVQQHCDHECDVPCCCHYSPKPRKEPPLLHPQLKSYRAAVSETGTRRAREEDASASPTNLLIRSQGTCERDRSPSSSSSVLLASAAATTTGGCCYAHTHSTTTTAADMAPRVEPRTTGINQKQPQQQQRPWMASLHDDGVGDGEEHAPLKATHCSNSKLELLGFVVANSGNPFEVGRAPTHPVAPDGVRRQCRSLEPSGNDADTGWFAKLPSMDGEHDGGRSLSLSLALALYPAGNGADGNLLSSSSPTSSGSRISLDLSLSTLDS